MNSQNYASTADALTKRIVAMGDVILTIESPWDLFKAGLECEDLQPSLYQASFALGKAKAIRRLQSLEGATDV